MITQQICVKHLLHTGIRGAQVGDKNLSIYCYELIFWQISYGNQQDKLSLQVNWTS